MHLLSDSWMPVRGHDGRRRWIAPHELSDPTIACFDADRADFNGALAQFAIGLLQTAAAPQSPAAWREWFRQPPEARMLASAFAQHTAAFELAGDGPRFMQDMDLRAGDGEAVGIGNLLIDSPGENALRNNSDLFVKRGRVQGMCQRCAAAALFTLQVNAPTGGAGHRTGLRGGGPLTTLLVASAEPAEPRCLWHTLWLNVQEPQGLEGGDPNQSDAHCTFPWMASITALQPPDGSVAPVQVHPLHAFWAMPRRIRIDFDATTDGVCDVCGLHATQLVRQFVTRNYGLNYKGAWRHPLSPYYEAKGDWLPMHPQPGGIGYRHWLAWVLGMQDDRRKVEAATVVSHFLRQDGERRLRSDLRMWAFGFDMDNMKARCWYEATLPMFSVGALGLEERQALRAEVGSWIAGAELAASLLRGAVKDAWFSAEARGDFSTIDASFWAHTELPFYRLLADRVGCVRDGRPWQSTDAAQRWHEMLRKAAIDLFDRHFVGTGVIERQNPRRIAQAFERLKRNLNGPKLRAALQLPAIAPPPKPASKSTKRKEEKA